MKTEQVMERNERILNNWKENRCIDSCTDLVILGSLLNVNIPISVQNNFYHADYDERFESVSWSSSGANKMICKVIDKLEKAIEETKSEDGWERWECESSSDDWDAVEGWNDPYEIPQF